MNLNYLDIEGLVLRDESFSFVVVGLLDYDKEITLNDLYTDGKSYARDKLNEKKPQLQGYIKTNDLTNILKLNALMAKRGLKKLTVGFDGLPLLYAMVGIENKVADAINPSIMSFQLVMPDPYLYCVEPSDIFLGAISSNSLTFPFTFSITFGDITGGQGIITNQGNAVAYPVITVVGSCNTLVISNETTGESMSLNISLGASDTLIIDNRPNTRGITINGQNRIDLKQGNWISCEPGDNLFTFSRNSIESTQHCTIELQSRWI